MRITELETYKNYVEQVKIYTAMFGSTHGVVTASYDYVCLYYDAIPVAIYNKHFCKTTHIDLHKVSNQDLAVCILTFRKLAKAI